MPDYADTPIAQESSNDDEVKILGKVVEHNSMLGSMIRIGRVVATEPNEDANNPAKPEDIPRVLVQIGAHDTHSFIRNWLPWLSSRAGYDSEWWQPDLDEQVLIAAPSGNIEQGFIIGSIYRGSLTFDGTTESGGSGGDIVERDPVPQNEIEKQIHQRIYLDGSRFSYDRNAHRFSVELKNGQEETDTLRFSAAAQSGSGSIDLSIGNESSPDFKLTIKSDQHMVLNAGQTVITVNKDGAVNIDAGTNDITIKGNVKVTGTMDVS